MSKNKKRVKKLSIYFFKSDYENVLSAEIEILAKELNEKYIKEGNEIFLPETLYNELLNALTFLEVKSCDGLGYHKNRGNKIRITLRREDDI